MVGKRVLLAALTAACAALSTSCNQPLLNPAVVNPDHAVVYLVTGTTHSAHVVFVNIKGGSEEVSVPLPWKYEFFTKSGARVYVSASRLHGEGTLKVEITSDGKTIFQSDADSGDSLIGVGGPLP